MKTKYFDNLLLVIPLIIINIISLFNMINARLINSSYEMAFVKQLIWFIIGFIFLLILRKINLTRVFKLIPYLYIINIFLLLIVLVIGKEINGAKCWLQISGFSFQPSEIMKIILPILLVNILDKSNLATIKNQIIFIFKILFLTLIPCLLVFLEPDTGAIINYLLILLVIFLYAKLNKSFYILLFLIFISGVTIFFCLYFYNQDLLINILGTSFFYRMDRIINFASGSSYQLENALITIGAASMFKFNFKEILLYIPEAPTDFMFAFNIGNYGIISGLIIIISYFIIELYILAKSKKSKRKKNKILISTFNLLFIFQVLYNIFMNIGLVPIMGIPLPFFSYGGTSALINYITMGLILNLLNNKNSNMV